MSFANTSTVRHCLRRNDGADQVLQVRLGYFSRLISRSPSAGLPYEILRETSSTPMADARFPLPPRELEDPLFCHAYVLQLLSSFNLVAVASDAIARKITSFVAEFAAGNYDDKFQIVADIDYIQMFWIDRSSDAVENVSRGVMVDETVIFEEAVAAARRGASETVIERLRKEKLKGGFGGEELGDCCVCLNELNCRKDVARIPCGHVYHQSCILTWLKKNNSCPLCRRRLAEE